MSDEKIAVAGRAGAHPGTPASKAAGGSPGPIRHATEAHAAILRDRFGDLPAMALLQAMLREVFRGRIAVLSSFGTESAVLLDLVARVDPATPVLFLDTGKLFAETLEYRDALAARLGLTDIRVVRPSAWALDAEDRGGELWRVDADRCCRLRKVMPLTIGLTGFDAWITGRKRFQGGERGQLSTIEAGDADKIKINPLANWTFAEIAAHFTMHDLPSHALRADGYRSIGCVPCSSRANAWEGPRAGRWRHTKKTECGIHGLLFRTDDECR